MNNPNIISRRKLYSAAILLTVGVGITLIKGDIPNNLNSLLESLYFAFVLGNMGEHATNSYMAHLSQKYEKDQNKQQEE